MKRTFRIIAGLVALGIVLCASAAASTIAVKTLNNCKGQFYSEIGNYRAAPGNTYLVVGLEIEYQGPDTFTVDPSFFSASINKFDYKNSVATYDLGSVGMNPLPTGSLRNGGTARGYIAFEVPQSSGDFQIIYNGWENVEKNYMCVA